jgi:competence protein ComFC
MLKYFLNLIFPVECSVCSAAADILCVRCVKKINLNTLSYGGVINGWTFAKYHYRNEEIKKILHTIKYYHHPKLAEKLGETCAGNIIQDSFLIPVPISEKRLKERGYNQAFHIAKGMCNKKVLDILTRKNDTKKLKDLHGIDIRLEEVQNSISLDQAKLNKYLIENSLNVKDIKITLIDDITTTGATFYEARRALVEHGFSKENIYAFAVAH